MNQGAIQDETCRAFEVIDGPGAGRLLRFIVGEDLAPQEMSTADIETQLGDPFATLLLLKGKFPTTADDVLVGIDAATPEGDPLRKQRSFVLGEGSQLLLGADDIESTNRGIRFLVARGAEGQPPDLIISASHPQKGLVEVMAWDQTHLGFNFYRTLRGAGGWVWAGNSRHALMPPTKGKGPFESHPSGNLIMKEFKLPWVHWDSFKSHIQPTAFAADDARREHPWFTDTLKGAEICETGVVTPTVQRWTAVHLDRAVGPDGVVADPPGLIEQIVTSATVNLASSETVSGAAALGSAIDIPPTFFADGDGLALVGLPQPPKLSVPGLMYTESLRKFDFVLTDGNVREPGDTHFGFLIPERAFEDKDLIRQALERVLLTKRLVATLLMVDFPNPVFSARRARLLDHVPARTPASDGASLSQEIANAVMAAANPASSDSPEAEFGERWKLGEDAWQAAFTAELTEYYTAVQEHLSTQAGFDDYVRLADSRRNRVRQMPIFESRLLFPETNIPPVERFMRPDGTVAESLGG